ncbi:MAG: hypothetical protein J0H63_10650 [Rhizobiales bacterium]|nr:hypothetical protein [Hyphomicrobiales bacterium]MBN9010563.1 hypothetical protein [Hyphomicrobiales bacterium]
MHNFEDIKPGARLRGLEYHLRVKLFHRLNRGLAFTEPGQRYFSSLQEIFVSINNATNEIAFRGSRQKADHPFRTLHWQPVADAAAAPVCRSLSQY